MCYLKILLTVFIIGLSISSANGQTNHKTNERLFLYDSSEVVRIAELILENETMKENEKLYHKKDSLYNVNRILFENKLKSLNEIIMLKNEQIEKMEKTPLQIMDKSWRWWHYTLAAIGAVTFGFTVGIVYENIR
jgi:hypothetical protein